MRPLTLLLMLTLWLSSGPAAAAIALHYELTDLAREADEVVHGRVIGQTSYWDDHVIMTEVTVEVVECLKGERPAGERVVVRQPGGRVGELAMLVPGMPTFLNDEVVVLFLEAGSVEGASLVMGLAQGRFTVAADAETGEVLVRRDLTGLARVGQDGRMLDTHEGPAPHGLDPREGLDVMARRALPLAEQVRMGPVELPFERFMAELRGALREVGP
jgi:hypothetical protein